MSLKYALSLSLVASLQLSRNDYFFRLSSCCCKLLMFQAEQEEILKSVSPEEGLSFKETKQMEYLSKVSRLCQI